MVNAIIPDGFIYFQFSITYELEFDFKLEHYFFNTLANTRL